MKSFIVMVSLLIANLAHAQQVIELYDGIAPGSEKWTWEEGSIEPAPGHQLVYNVTQPTITVFKANEDIRTGAAVLVAPGGAFHILSMDNEGVLVPNSLTS